MSARIIRSASRSLLKSVAQARTSRSSSATLMILALAASSGVALRLPRS